MTRRDALWIVACLLGSETPQAQTVTCRPYPEVLRLSLGAGACSVKRIEVTFGALTATIPVSELMAALGAKVG